MTVKKEDIEAIKQLAEDWRSGWLAGDADALLSLYADEPVLMPQDQPVIIGKDAIRLIYEAVLKEVDFQSEWTIEEVVVSGDMGYFRSAYTLTATPKAGGEPMRVTGKSIYIVKRDSGGSWKIARLIDNTDGTPPSGDLGQVKMEPRISIITLGVSDLDRSIRFYRDGLGFETKAKEGDEIAFFGLIGTALALYPDEKLAADIGPDVRISKAFSGITLAHNVRKKEEVAEVLSLAEKSGGVVVKQAQDVFWGGHSGYFADPDGYYWEVAWAPNVTFDENGNLEF